MVDGQPVKNGCDASDIQIHVVQWSYRNELFDKLVEPQQQEDVYILCQSSLYLH